MGLEGSSKKEKKKTELIHMEKSVVIAGPGGWVEMEEGMGGQMVIEKMK